MAVAPDHIKLACPAKVNLALSVGAPNPQGLHPIASWMVALDLADALVLQRSDAGASHFDVAFDIAPDSPARALTVDWPLEKDLAFRAHAMLEREANRTLPIVATLRKRIPPGGGLAGGSANAAAMLIGLNRLFNLKLTEQQLQQLGHQLGSDVPFAVATVSGSTCSSLVTGLGQELTDLPPKQIVHLAMVFPPFGCPTGDVYRAFDKQHALDVNNPRKPDVQAVRTLAHMNPLAPAAPFNDLAAPAMTVQPKLAALSQEIQRLTDLPVHVTGSGSTLFVVAPNAPAAQAMAANIADTLNLSAAAVQTLN